MDFWATAIGNDDGFLQDIVFYYNREEAILELQKGYRQVSVLIQDTPVKHMALYLSPRILFSVNTSCIYKTIWTWDPLVCPAIEVEI